MNRRKAIITSVAGITAAVAVAPTADAQASQAANPELEQIRARFLHSRGDLHPIDRDTLMKRVRSGKVVVIDVRPREEYRTAHIPGALAIPLPELKRRLSEFPRNKEIVAYCRGPFCVMAIDAVQLLRSRGLRAHRLEASVLDWKALGFPVVTGDEPAGARASRST